MNDSIHQQEFTVSERKAPAVPAFIIAALVFLIPVFMIPSQDVPLQFTKVLLALAGVVVLFITFALNTLRTRSLSLPFSTILLSILLLPAAFLVSAVFSGNPALSLSGYQFDADTTAFIALCAALAFTVALSLPNNRQVFTALLGLIGAGVVVIVLEAVQLFFGGLPFPFFDLAAANTIGAWNGLAVFFGLLAVLSLVALESLSFSRLTGAVVYLMLAASLAILVIVNFSVVWILVAVISFALLVYAFMRQLGKGEGWAMKGATAGLVFIIALFFIYDGMPKNQPNPPPSIATGIQTALNIQTLEVRPSLQGTLSVFEASYGKNFLFGTGPNSFSSQWLISRPQEVIGTLFWNIPFSVGFGSIPSSMATGGAVVAFAWVFLVLAVLWGIIRGLLLVPEGRGHSYFLVATTAIGSFYLLALHVFYAPDQTVTLLMFAFFGLFLASVRDTALSRELSVSFSESPRLGFASVLVILALSVAALASLYGGASSYMSSIRNIEAINKSFTNDLDGARTAILSAISLSAQDRYYRSLAAIELSRLDALVGSGATDEAAQNSFREILTNAITASQRATELNPASYENWLSRASVFSAVVPLKIDGARENAEAALAEARKYNPLTPEIDYRLAQLQFATGDRKQAEAFAREALKKKADYTPAILLLAQLSLNAGDINEAITSVESAVFLEPNNAQLLYQLGLLQLQDKRYTAATDSFKKALVISPDYANASFFLAQAYTFLGKRDEALTELRKIRTVNPDNTLLSEVIQKLEAGENPFTASETGKKDVETPTE